MKNHSVSYALHGGNFCKEKLQLVSRIVSFDTARMHLLTFRILEPYLSKDVGLDYVISH